MTFYKFYMVEVEFVWKCTKQHNCFIFFFVITIVNSK